MILAVLYPSYFKPEKLLLFSDEFVEQEKDSNIINIVAVTFKTIIMGILINTFIIKYQKTKKNKYILYSYFTMLLYTLLSTGYNRLNMIIPLVIFVLITDKVFKWKGRILLIGASVILVTSITAVTVSKFNYKYDNNSDFSYVLTESVGDIQEYTSNIRPIALGIDAIKYYKQEIGIKTLFNDFFGSLPMISHYINQNNRLNNYYNLYVLQGINTSQIVPMVVSSVAYFSMALPTVMTIVIMIIVMYLEGKSYRKTYNNYLEMYMKIFLVFQLAFCCLNGNVQMIVGKVIVKYVPVMILLWLNKKSRI